MGIPLGLELSYCFCLFFVASSCVVALNWRLTTSFLTCSALHLFSFIGGQRFLGMRKLGEV